MVRSTAFILSILLLLTSAGVMACSGPKATTTPPFFKLGDSVNSVAAAPDGSVWVSLSAYGDEYGSTPVSYGTGVAHLTGPATSTDDRRAWTTYTTKDGLPSNWASPIAAAPDGTAWFGSAGGVTRFTPPAASTGDGPTWTTYTVEDGLAGEVQAIAIAPDGAVWFGALGGVSRFTGTDGQEPWTTYTTDDGLPEDLVSQVAVVNDIAVAPDGVVWVGTDHDGVARFDGKAWSIYTEADGLADNSVNAVDVAPDGTVWVGTHSGVSRLTHHESGVAKGGTWTTYTQAHGLAPTGINSIVAAPDSTVWVSYYGWSDGISHLSGESWTTYTEEHGLPSNAVTCIDVAPDGALWVGTGAGTLSRFTGKTWTTFSVQDIISE